MNWAKQITGRTPEKYKDTPKTYLRIVKKKQASSLNIMMLKLIDYPIKSEILSFMFRRMRNLYLLP